jgi:hypothetical protein
MLLARIVLAGVAFHCAIACGGNSTSNGTDAGNGGAGSSSAGVGASPGAGGGAGVGVGSAGRGGSVATGGASGAGTGGSVATGGASGAGTGGSTTAGSGSGGSAGAGGACTSAPRLVSGECTGGFYVDPESKECKAAGPYTCIEGARRFNSLAECLEACPDVVPARDACSFPSECGVTSAGCCGLCPDAALDTAVGVNLQRELLGGDPGCVNVLCGECETVPVPNWTIGYFVPTCTTGKCGVEDLRTTDATACDEDSDCFLRIGSACCELCAGDAYVALSSTAFLDTLCPADLACPPCAPNHSPDYAARCEDGHCTVDFAVMSENR